MMLLAITAAHVSLIWRRLLAYLRYSQQEGYDGPRFLKWAQVRSLGDPAVWLSIGCWWLYVNSPWTSTALFVAGILLLGRMQPDPRRSGKIVLRLTWRATRIFAVALVFALLGWVILLAAAVSMGTRVAFVTAAVSYALLPLVLIAANRCLAPYEKNVQARYEDAAIERVKAVAPFTIGITGSYGKSSTKSMLAHVLQFHGPTLAATGSINTLMGLTRHICEELVPGYQFMVVEMGAFGRGSIQRLCELTPPSAGVITAVGDMHLERFGSAKEIIRAKSELAAALPRGGLLVANADSPGALEIARQAANCRVLLYGEQSQERLDTRLEGVTFSERGTSFVLRTADGVRACFTPLLGRPIILNLAGAFTLAVALGENPDVIVAAFRTLKPVPNRLEVVRERGVTWIRDAYNSNQFGFRAALEVVTALPATRRFLVTPGVIELGAEQFEVNRVLAREAAAVCDATVVVTSTNREAFVTGHREVGHESKLVSVSGRAEAFGWLRDTVKEGDAVVLENDLPDLYERHGGLFWPTRLRRVEMRT